jgi:hypothetical protein
MEVQTQQHCGVCDQSRDKGKGRVTGQAKVKTARKSFPKFGPGENLRQQLPPSDPVSLPRPEPRMGFWVPRSSMHCLAF